MQRKEQHLLRAKLLMSIPMLMFLCLSKELSLYHSQPSYEPYKVVWAGPGLLSEPALWLFHFWKTGLLKKVYEATLWKLGDSFSGATVERPSLLCVVELVWTLLWPQPDSVVHLLLWETRLCLPKMWRIVKMKAIKKKLIQECSLSSFYLPKSRT
jgi:hypothetical protein